LRMSVCVNIFASVLKVSLFPRNIRGCMWAVVYVGAGHRVRVRGDLPGWKAVADRERPAAAGR
jgi:hypothetical protein